MPPKVSHLPKLDHSNLQRSDDFRTRFHSCNESLSTLDQNSIIVNIFAIYSSIFCYFSDELKHFASYLGTN